MYSDVQPAHSVNQTMNMLMCRAGGTVHSKTGIATYKHNDCHLVLLPATLTVPS